MLLVELKTVGVSGRRGLIVQAHGLEQADAEILAKGIADELRLEGPVLAFHIEHADAFLRHRHVRADLVIVVGQLPAKGIDLECDAHLSGRGGCIAG